MQRDHIKSSDFVSMAIKFYTSETDFLEVISRKGGELYSACRRGAFFLGYQTEFEGTGVELKNSTSGNKFCYQDRQIGCMKIGCNIMCIEIDDTVRDRVILKEELVGTIAIEFTNYQFILRLGGDHYSNWE